MWLVQMKELRAFGGRSLAMSRRSSFGRLTSSMILGLVAGLGFVRENGFGG